MVVMIVIEYVTELENNLVILTKDKLLIVLIIRPLSTGLFKMIHPVSNDYIFEVYKYRVISDTSTKRTTVEVLSLTL
jgi:hypothetical protein